MATLKVAFLSSAVLEFFASVAIAVVAMYIGFGLLGYIDYGPSPELSLFSGLFILLLAPEFFQPLRSITTTGRRRWRPPMRWPNWRRWTVRLLRRKTCRITRQKMAFNCAMYT